MVFVGANLFARGVARSRPTKTLSHCTGSRIRCRLTKACRGRIRIMQILALDASTDVCAVALGDGTHWAERAENAGQRHSELLLPMVRALLAETRLDLAALDGIAFGAGPGSFTGLRIACGVAQGLALGADLPMVGVATLEAMAEAARQRSGRTHVIATLDARMQEIYIAAYEHDGFHWRVVLDPVVVMPSEAPLPPGGGWTGVGNGFVAYPAPGEAQLLNLTVAPEVRRLGIGRTLLGRFLADACARGAEQCFLEVRVSNIPAIALYAREGFAPVARRIGYYPSAAAGPREDALVMRRALSRGQGI